MKRLILCVILCGCGVEKGGKTTSLPVQPSTESFLKKNYQVDLSGYSSGRFVFTSGLSYGAATIDAAGNTYILFQYFVGYGDDERLVTQAIKFGPDGKVVAGFDPVGNFEQVHGEFLLHPRALTTNAQGQLILLADTKETADFQAKVTGTSVVSFTADGYLNSAFGTSGLVRSAETGYRSIQTSNNYVYVGGNAMRRLAISDGASDKLYGKSGDLATTTSVSFMVSAADVLIIEPDRFDAAGVKTGEIDYLGTEVGYDPGKNGFFFYQNSSQTMTLIGEDGNKVESFGTGGTATLSWLSKLSYPVFSLKNNRVLAMVSSGETAGYSVFNNDGTQISGAGVGGNVVCPLSGDYFEVLLLPTGNVLVFDDNDGSKEARGRIRHMGPDCQEVGVN